MASSCTCSGSVTLPGRRPFSSLGSVRPAMTATQSFLVNFTSGVVGLLLERGILKQQSDIVGFEL